MMQKLVITGATGCIGRALVAAGLESGWSVRGVARSDPPEWWPRQAEYVRASVEDSKTLALAVGRADAVVHLAAPAHGADTRPQSIKDRHRVTVDGTSNVARAASVSGSRFVLVSSVAVYGSPALARIDQVNAPNPSSQYGLAKMAAEDRSRAECPAVLILRCCVVYGPGDRGNVAKLIRAVDRGQAFTVGDGGNRKSMLFSRNLADRIMSAIDQRLEGPWCVADSPAPSQRELFDEIADVLGRPVPRSFPLVLARFGARTLDALAWTFRQRTTWSSTIETLSSSTVVDGSALDSRLGIAQTMKLREGLMSTVSWMRSSSELSLRA